MRLVNPGRPPPAAMRAVIGAGPPSRTPAASLRPVLGEGGRLPLAGAPGRGELLLQVFTVTLPVIPLLDQLRVLLFELLDARVPRIPFTLRPVRTAALAVHQNHVLLIGTRTPILHPNPADFSPRPLNEYPTAYKLRVKRPGSDESRDVSVDLLETFNWLIGLTVRHIAGPQAFSAAFERDSEKRLRLKGRLKQDADGPYWFRTVNGATPDGRRTLVIWRKLTGEPERDNLVLDEWFAKQDYSAKDSEFDLIYVNGGNNLENLKTPDDLWKVRLIEEDFHRLMFEMERA